MTQDEIIEMAKQAGFTGFERYTEFQKKMLTDFAKLVAAKERERLADIAQKNGNEILAMQLRGEA